MSSSNFGRVCFLNGRGVTFLDGFGDVLTCPPEPIKKFTFGCLVNLKKKQLKKLTRGLLAKMITFKERPMKEGGLTSNPCTHSQGF
jgi:hypothetical protein